MAQRHSSASAAGQYKLSQRQQSEQELDTWNAEAQVALVPSKALYDFMPVADSPNKLSFNTGDTVYVIKQHDSGWWNGLMFDSNNRTRSGWFPASYVKIIDSSNERDESARRVMVKLKSSKPDSLPEKYPSDDTFTLQTDGPQGRWPGQEHNFPVVPVQYLGSSSSLSNSPNASSGQLYERFKSPSLNNVSQYQQVIPVSPKLSRGTGFGSSSSSLQGLAGNMKQASPTSQQKQQLKAISVPMKNLVSGDQEDDFADVNDLNRTLTVFKSMAEQEQREFANNNNDEGLPACWGRKYTPDGREYFYNYETNETVWSLEDKGRVVRSDPGQNDEIEKGVDRQSFMLDSKWDVLVNKIVDSISNLNQSAKHGRKKEFMPLSRVVVSSIRDFLSSCGTVERDSTVLVQYPLLKPVRTELLQKLGSFVVAVKDASKVWPPPDAVNAMRNALVDVLNAVKNYSNTATVLKIPLFAPPKRQQSNSSNSQPLGPTTSYTTENDITSKLDDLFRSIKNWAKALITMKSDSTSVDQVTEFSLRIIKDASSILAVLSEYDIEGKLAGLENISGTSQKLQREYGMRRKLIENNISGLQLSLNDFSDPFAPPDVINQFIAQAHMVLKAAQEIILAAKKIIDFADSFLDSRQSEKTITELTLISKVKTDEMENSPRTPISPSPGRFGDGLKPKSPFDRKPQLSPYSSKTEISSASSNDVLSEFSEDIQSNLPSKNKGKRFFAEVTPILIAPEKYPPTENDIVSAFLQPDYANEDLVFNSENKVKAGTLQALIEYLTSHVGREDKDFRVNFMFCFRLFLNSADFANRLFGRYSLPIPLDAVSHMKLWKSKKLRPVQKRVLDIFVRWLNDYWYENEDKNAFEVIRNGAMKVIRNENSDDASIIFELCDRREEMRTKISGFSKLSISTNNSSPGKSSVASPKFQRKSRPQMKILEIEAIEIERQLTMLDAQAFFEINPIDFLYYQPLLTGKKNSDKLPDDNDKIRRMIHRSNQITGWVAETILLEKDLKQRAKVLKHFIKVAECCHKHQNYASREAIISALNSSPIYRLRKTWESLHPKVKETFDTLALFMDRKNNFATYRQQLKMATPPCIPFIGLFLTDITFIKQGNSDMLNKGRLINFEKYSRLASVLREIRRLQSGSFAVEVSAELQEQLKAQLEISRDIQDLHELSLSIEPRSKNS